jgi:hypothetical protein
MYVVAATKPSLSCITSRRPASCDRAHSHPWPSSVSNRTTQIAILHLRRSDERASQDGRLLEPVPRCNQLLVSIVQNRPAWGMLGFLIYHQTLGGSEKK